MTLTMCEYRGYLMSLCSSDAGHSVLVHASGVVLGFARSSPDEGLRVAFKKACAVVDAAHREPSLGNTGPHRPFAANACTLPTASRHRISIAELEPVPDALRPPRLS